MLKSNGRQLAITPYSKEYLHIVDILCESFIPGRGIPLCLTCPKENKSTVYTASTTATALLALHHIGKLDDTLRHNLQEAVFMLKSNTSDVTQREELVAWDALEGISSWTTSLAIWALLATGYDGDRLGEIKAAALWLVDQQEDGGWGGYADDPINFFTTGVVLHALKIVIAHATRLRLVETELRKIKRARTNGLKSIRASKRTRGKIIYWEIDTEKGKVADPTSTQCALWALHEAGEDQQEGDKDLIAGGIFYLRASLQQETVAGKARIWPFRQVLSSSPVHGPPMTVTSFTPSFVIPLLAMKCSPFDPVCLAPIEWLQRNRLPNEEGWPHLNFGHTKGHAVSFTTAYALWGIANWYKYASTSIHEQQTQVKSLRRQRTLLIGLVIIISISLLLPLVPIARIFPSIQHLYTSMLGFNDQIQFLWTILSIVIAVIAVAKWLDSALFGNSLSRALQRLTQRLRQNI